VVGTSGERLLVVLVVKESEDMEEVEENGVWVLCEVGGVENVSILKSGSKGELEDGEGKGVWTFIGNVKVHGVGEITLRTG
jgi:hypothetical protein